MLLGFAPFLNSSNFMVLWCKIMIFEVLIYNVSSNLMSKCYITIFGYIKPQDTNKEGFVLTCSSNPTMSMALHTSAYFTRQAWIMSFFPNLPFK